MSNTHTHILFILDHFPPYVGGAEMLFDNLTKRLVRDGFKVTILTTRYDPHLPDHETLDDGRVIYRVCSNRYVFILGSIPLAIRLTRQADIIHTTTYSGALPTYIAKHITKKPAVITIHEVFHDLWYRFMGWKGFFYKFFESFVLFLRFDRYICVSDYTRNSLRLIYNIPDAHLFTIYNGIDEVFFSRDAVTQEQREHLQKIYHTDQKKNILFYGRPGVSKGLEFLIDAIPSIVKSIPESQFLLIIGNNPKKQREEIMQKIKDLNLEEHILIIPPQTLEQLRTHISIVDLVVIPSLAEGFGFAAAEVCSMGTPLLTTNAGALPEVVSGTHRIVDAGNSEAIALGVKEFFLDGYETAAKKHFSWEKNEQEVRDIYADFSDSTR